MDLDLYKNDRPEVITLIVELAKTKYNNLPRHYVDYFKTQMDTEVLRSQLCQLAEALVVDVRGFMDFLPKNGNTQQMLTLLCQLF